MSRLLLPVLLLSVALSSGRSAERYDMQELAARVVILANSTSDDSRRVAAHYAGRRGIPVENIVMLPASGAEVIGWPEFLETLYLPLQEELLRRDWIEASTSTVKDTLGRPKRIVSATRISYLVVCRGIPLKIAHDPVRYSPVPPVTDHAEFRTNAGAVDAELSLIAASGYPISGLVMNPWYSRERSPMFERFHVVKVSRLDGPTLEAALGLVDSALEAERLGLAGRAYVDISGPHRAGDGWLEETARELKAAGWAPSVHGGEGTLGPLDRFDAPALYFGWYAWDVNGPFTVPGFRFPPGAVALHLHSFSARTLAHAQQGWAGPLVQRGVAATVGNVFEPYLEFTHQPHLLLKALLAGRTWGDAVYYSLRAVSWQAVALGDPLYRPFARSHAEQWHDRETLPDDTFAYVICRELHRLGTGVRPEEALSLAAEVMQTRPSRPVALAWLELARELKDDDALVAGAQWLQAKGPGGPLEWPLHRAAAEVLATANHPQWALSFYETLIEVEEVPAASRQVLLQRGVDLARAAQRPDLVHRWTARMTPVVPPSPESK